jgi:putative DNA primase/helicase
LPVQGTDWAIWRRIKVLPFGVQIVHPDHTLPGRLRAELPGILAWALRGCIEQYADGLGSCHAVENASAIYREGEDRIGQFLAEMCELELAARARSDELGKAYAQWEQAHERAPAKDFFNRLGARGIGSTKSNNVRYRTGIRLREGVQ